MFPLVPGSKLPMTEKGVLDATTDVRQIKAWWAGTPEANIGGACGFVFDVLDIDEGGEDTLQGHDPIGPTPEVSTPAGGTHLFLEPCLFPLKNAVKFAPGLDFRTKGGYVVLPPSENATGKWKWKIRLDEPMTEIPGWITKTIKKTDEEKQLTAVPAAVVSEGGRNDTLFRHSCLLRRFGYQEQEILGALDVLNRSRCSPPLPRQELEAVARHAAKYQPEREPGAVTIEDSHARSGLIGEFATSGKPKGVASGFGFLDANTTSSGFPSGQLTVVSAYTGGGKSAFMLQAAYNIASRGIKVCYATFADLSGENLFDRLVKNLSGWYGGDEPLDPVIAERWHEARREVKALPIHVHDVSDLRVGREVEVFSSWFKERKDEFGILLCDYGQEMRSVAGRSDYEHADLVSSELRWLAADTLLPIGVGSQITPGNEKTGQLDITKGSRKWEERAGLYLKIKVLDEDAAAKVDSEYRGLVGLTSVKIAKNRFGKSGLKDYWRWLDGLARFEELS